MRYLRHREIFVNRYRRSKRPAANKFVPFGNKNRQTEIVDRPSNRTDANKFVPFGNKNRQYEFEIRNGPSPNKCDTFVIA
jgi:hypothetical protein